MLRGLDCKARGFSLCRKGACRRRGHGEEECGIAIAHWGNVGLIRIEGAENHGAREIRLRIVLTAGDVGRMRSP